MGCISNQIISFEGQKYAIPQENLKELVRISAGETKNKIDKVGNCPVVRLRGEFLPLLDLADVFGISKSYLSSHGELLADRRKQIADRRSFQHLAVTESSDFPDEASFIEREAKDRRTNPESAVNIVIVYAEAYKYGLIVDKFYDSEALEVLPTGRYLSGCGIYLGCAVIKDESPILVLDIFNIAHSMGLSQTTEKGNDVRSGSLSHKNPNLKKYALLIFKSAESEYFAVDLDSVERLERFNRSSFEKIGNDEVIQYRGGALTLFEPSQVLPCSPSSESRIQEVVVLKHRGVLAGLKATPPIDTFEGCLSLDKETFNTPPILGSVILNGNTTLLLDVSTMVTKIKGRSNT